MIDNHRLNKMSTRKTKIFLAKRVAKQTGLPLSTVKEILSWFLITVKNKVREEERVTLRGLGSFYLKKRNPRRYRNIRTGEVQSTTGEPIVSFAPSRCLTEAVNANKSNLVDSNRSKKETSPSIHEFSNNLYK